MQRRQYSLSLSLSTGLLIVANSLIPVAILLFATGFFPYKPFLPGLAQYEALGYGAPPPAPFDRLVFMVVDALRSDFVYANGSGFGFTQSLIADGAAMPFTAHATSPTITMPRIKAITTGSIPSFLDVILNFDEADTSSSLASQDTWLAQMKAKEAGKLVMYGDDTWLKLFPDTFDRADGTSSFFVSDFTEVDRNVTRHIADELRQDDWSTMVLHYLGLDHIGHKAGPRSPNMIPKQREMDGIVQQIYKAIEIESHLQSTLLVLLGDHGMNDAGNHGASSPGETSPALVFMSPKLKTISKPATVPAPYVDEFQYYSFVEQSDLAPTLGALLGFPVPKNNLGAFIMDFLPFWPEKRDQVNILMHNTRQILEIVAAASGNSLLANTYSGIKDCHQVSNAAEELACRWHSINGQAGNDPDGTWSVQVTQWLQEAQSLMSSMASNYDMNRLLSGAVTAALALLLSLVATLVSAQTATRTALPLAGITLLYGIMMFASSYVEEEHHFWYWSTSAWVVYLAFKGMSKTSARTIGGVLLVLTVVRLIRGWNQTGQKFAGEPDIVKLFLASNPQLLWCLIIGTYWMVAVQLLRGFGYLPSAVSFPLSIGLVASAVSFKLAFTNEDAPELVIGFARSVLDILDGPSLVTRARAVFFGLVLAAVCPVYVLATHRSRNLRLKAIRTLHHLCTLLALTQSRATNIPLFLLLQVLHMFLEHLNLDTVEITTSSLLLQLASFFAMGGSNAISSIDLSSAYNGVSDYNVVAVGVLTFISNWAGPVWWTSATSLLLLQNQARNGGNVYKQHVGLLTVFTTASLAFVMAACTALRTHLFIWTVFSPKYLYSMAWSLGQHIAINIGFGGLLYGLGRGR
ncbi:GPI ethanolamine phosphate transferase [Pseudomassariella vexata]|uniref:GPI ethanolamine phosphate transferase 2 n=1 Tax=Pseudomassariella vexata TaxID=1141098 RepID=A0A1Y2DWH7_9PEZI|nr:GPI ethanolamine phosphate transferase [Pseudomassariella vexata]ORY63496.1 GPI ethanolamine phosphate transferase [Pseudomassariella vexata]